MSRKITKSIRRRSHRQSTKLRSVAEKLYTENISSLVRTASRHLQNRDEAYDVAHEAFSKFLIYLSKNKLRDIMGSSFILQREVMRACRRHNRKTSIEVPTSVEQMLEKETNEEAD